MGNHLGAADPHRARTAVVAGVAAAPLLLVVTGVLLLEPHCQLALLHAFAGANASPQLRTRLIGLLRIMAALQACDCVQYQMQGVVQVRSLLPWYHGCLRRPR